MKSYSAAVWLSALLVLGLSVGRSSAQAVSTKTDLSSVGSGLKETTFGDLAADSLRDAADTDAAFVPSSAMRPVTLSAPSIQQEKIADVLSATTAPENAYVTLRVKGKQILAALERSVSHLPESFDGYLQVSGLKVTYDPSRPPGSRIISVVFASGAALSPDSQYTAAMTQPLGLGGMGYFQAWNESDIVKTSDSSLQTVIVNYAASHQPLNEQVDGRLTSQ